MGLGIGFLELGRFIIGLGVGANLSVTNVYLSECAPVEIRGSITAVYIFGILAYNASLILSGNWRVMFLLSSVFATAQFLVLTFL